MSEAWGQVFIKASEEVMDEIAAEYDEISWDVLEQLGKVAGIESLEEANPNLAPHTDEAFHNEGVELIEDYVSIRIFGDQWMELIKALTNSGHGIEVYGEIAAEYGTSGYYALNAEGKRLVEVIDYESDINTDAEDDIKDQWRELIPDTLVDFFEED